MSPRTRKALARFGLAALSLLLVIALSAPLFGQATVATGSIQGTITDPSGAVVPGAQVTVTNKSTGQEKKLTTNNSGAYNTGPIIPGDYVVRATNKGFQTTQLPITVEVGVTSSGNLQLKVGQQSEVVEVQASEVRVNT